MATKQQFSLDHSSFQKWKQISRRSFPNNHRAMHKQYADCNNSKQIQKLLDTYTKLPRSEIKKSLEKWDRDQGRAMALERSIITKLQKPYSWSPAL